MITVDHLTKRSVGAAIDNDCSTARSRRSSASGTMAAASPPERQGVRVTWVPGAPGRRRGA